MSSYVEGQIHQLADALERAGATPDDLTKLGQSKQLPDFLGVLRGTHEIKPTEHILATIPGFNPAEFIDGGWKIIGAESDHRATALTSVNFAEVGFEICLKMGESSITGEEKLKRLRESGKIRLGAETFLALWQEKNHKTLKWLHKERGLRYLDFPGTVLERPGGLRCVLHLYRGDGSRWDWSSHWLGHDWSSDNFSVSLAS